jgi:membrane protein implicated in regulation of membrane protease activity
MIWWYWMLLGLVLLGVEMVTPGGFYILFFGLAALIVGSLTNLRLTEAEWFRWLLFSGLAILSLLVFRGPLLATLRSEIGKIELDRTFEERTNINIQVVNELDKASEAWGVKVLRYEIKNITPPKGVLDAMEKQMRGERLQPSSPSHRPRRKGSARSRKRPIPSSCRRRFAISAP